MLHSPVKITPTDPLPLIFSASSAACPAHGRILRQEVKRAGYTSHLTTTRDGQLPLGIRLRRSSQSCISHRDFAVGKVSAHTTQFATQYGTVRSRSRENDSHSIERNSVFAKTNNHLWRFFIILGFRSKSCQLRDSCPALFQDQLELLHYLSSKPEGLQARSPLIVNELDRLTY